ncbi:MAG: hypothetical protein KJ747_00565 [Actinobacteria bacterium]|nr:hypothetical protein [Actinomycetota bacterium]MCG2807384.1 hypothetical protein [Coriobacteriia bacterium]
MYQQDYILRQIEMMGALLRRMLAAIHVGKADESLEMVEQMLDEIGISPDLADSLPAEGLLAMLTAGGELDYGRAALLAAALSGRAEAFDANEQSDRAAQERVKADTLMSAAQVGLDTATREALAHLPRISR